MLTQRVCIRLLGALPVPAILLDDAGNAIGATAPMRTQSRRQKTIELVFELFGNDDNTGFAR